MCSLGEAFEATMLHPAITILTPCPAATFRVRQHMLLSSVYVLQRGVVYCIPSCQSELNPHCTSVVDELMHGCAGACVCGVAMWTSANNHSTGP